MCSCLKSPEETMLLLVLLFVVVVCVIRGFFGVFLPFWFCSKIDFVLSPLKLAIIAYDDGEPVKTNKTLVEITVLQPSAIPIFTQEEYR